MDPTVLVWEIPGLVAVVVPYRVVSTPVPELEG